MFRSIRLLKFAGILGLLAATTVGWAQEATAPTYERTLRRASMRLTGIPYRANINTAPVQTAEAYREQLIEFFKSPRFPIKMTNYVEELFGLSVRAAGSSNHTESEAFNRLVQKIFRDDLSWDLLLTSHELSVKVPMSDIGSDGSDYALLRELMKPEFDAVRPASKTDEVAKEVTAKMKQAQQQVAGAITTERFFRRYGTNVTNRNLGRAAAVFRIFLCDEMTPVILASEKENQSLLALALGEKPAAVVHSKANEISRHGSDPSCQSCHYKLEPVAKSFAGSGDRLSSSPVPSNLVFRRAGGEMVKVPTNGIGELARAITQQPEYASCQVRHFWDWMIGTDVPLTAERQAALVRIFEANGRRPRKLIAHLLTSPEFVNGGSSKSISITAAHVLPILKRCDQCHEGEALAPSLSLINQWTPDVLMKMANAIDVEDLKPKGVMPPASSKWQLTGEEKSTLLLWLKQGAKTDDGKAHLSAQQIAQLPDGRKLPALKSRPTTFDFTSSRFVRNYDYIALLESLVGGQGNENSQTFDPRSANYYDVPYRGPMMRDPFTRKPVSSQFNSPVFESYLSAIKQVLLNTIRRSPLDQRIKASFDRVGLAIDWDRSGYAFLPENSAVLDKLILAAIDWTVGVRSLTPTELPALRNHCQKAAATLLRTKPNASIGEVFEVIVQAALLSDPVIVE